MSPFVTSSELDRKPNLWTGAMKLARRGIPVFPSKNLPGHDDDKRAAERLPFEFCRASRSCLSQPNLRAKLIPTASRGGQHERQSLLRSPS